MAVASRSGRDSRGKSSGSSHSGISPETLRDMVGVFKLLADETRLKIIQYLLQQPEYNVRSLCEMLKQSQPAVSHHIALLRMSGLIECRREGKHNFYHLLPKRFRELRAIFESQSNKVVMERLFAD
jgi:ArsR family transcriptional regulator